MPKRENAKRKKRITRICTQEVCCELNSLSDCRWLPKEKHYRLGMLCLGNRIPQPSLLTKYQSIFELIDETLIAFQRAVTEVTRKSL